MTIEPIWDDPFTLDGLLARFWKRLDCRPDMAPDHRRHLLYLFTYSYGNQLRIKQNHRRETRTKWQNMRGRIEYRFTGLCWACGVDPPTHWHHIIPLARGGDNRRDNLVELCKPCHHTAHNLEREGQAG